MKLFATAVLAATIAISSFGAARADERTNLVVTPHNGVGLSYSAIKIGRIELGPVVTAQQNQSIQGGIEGTLMLTKRVGIGAVVYANRPAFTSHSMSLSNPQLQLSVRL